MKILVHDSGHAFPLQLSRHLAGRGHEVLHLYAASLHIPRGPVAPRPDDPANFTVRGISIGRPIDKYGYLKRVFQERAYGRLLAEEIVAFRPDVVLGGTASPDVQAAAVDICRKLGIGFVFWVQDLNAIAIDRLLRHKLPVLGPLAGRHYLRLEQRLLRQSDAVIAITEDFLPIFAGWGIARSRIHVIENWAARDDLPVCPRANAWSAEHGLNDKLVFLYSGTLGLKHNPELLLGLARSFAGRPDIRVVVVSEGLGADWLRAHAAGVDNFMLLPYQPFERLAEVTATGDVLVALLEADAGAFSVPSKILTYLCAGRPILASVPAENLATRVLARAGAGVAVPPGDAPGFYAAASAFAGSAERRTRLGNNALDYAAKTFDIRAIGERFEAILAQAARRT
ncbi:MAG: glycosyltransferase family 4 protein [Alphaproteobacteria bacterium]|nr:glycosyltransferase family 4 protein [Alphaproteobacteria bacterium]